MMSNTPTKYVQALLKYTFEKFSLNSEADTTETTRTEQLFHAFESWYAFDFLYKLKKKVTSTNV